MSARFSLLIATVFLAAIACSARTNVTRRAVSRAPLQLRYVLYRLHEVARRVRLSRFKTGVVRRLGRGRHHARGLVDARFEFDAIMWRIYSERMHTPAHA